MKNKLENKIEKFGELRSTDSSLKPSGRRDSSAPRIVVCPPMEENRLSPPIARGTKLFRAIGRRISRRSAGDDDESSNSSGSDSVSCEREIYRPRDIDRSSCSASESSDSSERAPRHRSTISFRKVFQSLSISPRSHSCATERVRPPKKNPQPKRILRPPVTYTYVRGLSGLPTQRVPRPRQLHVMSGLNR